MTYDAYFTAGVLRELNNQTNAQDAINWFRSREMDLVAMGVAFDELSKRTGSHFNSTVLGFLFGWNMHAAILATQAEAERK